MTPNQHRRFAQLIWPVSSERQAWNDRHRRPAAAVPFIKPATVTITTRQLALNICTAKVGGLRFVKIGRICFSYCVTKEYKPL